MRESDIIGLLNIHFQPSFPAPSSYRKPMTRHHAVVRNTLERGRQRLQKRPAGRPPHVGGGARDSIVEGGADLKKSGSGEEGW